MRSIRLYRKHQTTSRPFDVEQYGAFSLRSNFLVEEGNNQIPLAVTKIYLCPGC